MDDKITLYKRRNDGKIHELTYHLVGSKYRSISGILNGEKVTSEWTYVDGKNVGRSNQTTPEEQAYKEVYSIIKKKIEQHEYKQSIKDIDKQLFFKPMLAKPADLDRVAIEMHRKGYVFTQPKLDGMRCIANRDGLMSRAGKKIVSCKHIEDALKPFFDANPHAILDGELYNHELKDNFNELMSACRKTKNLNAQQAQQVQYHVYDVMEDDEAAWRFGDRWKWVYDNLEPFTNDTIQLVETSTATTIDEITTLAEKLLTEGYEGTMIRFHSPYQSGKRNWHLQKLKKFNDEEFIIIDFEEGKGNAEGLAVKCIVKTKQGVIVRPTMMGTVEYRQYIWDNPDEFIGKVATIKHFGYTKDGSLRHPNCKYIHETSRDDH